MTEKDVIEKFRRIMGYGSVLGPYARARRDDGGEFEDVYEWRVGSWNDVYRTYVLLLPWLNDRRRAQAAWALLGHGPLPR